MIPYIASDVWEKGLNSLKARFCIPIPVQTLTPIPDFKMRNYKIIVDQVYNDKLT